MIDSFEDVREGKIAMPKFPGQKTISKNIQETTKRMLGWIK